MPKRKCPFDTNLSQQLKIHISQKKFEERNDFAMNKIHGNITHILNLKFININSFFR